MYDDTPTSRVRCWMCTLILACLACLTTPRPAGAETDKQNQASSNDDQEDSDDLGTTDAPETDDETIRVETRAPRRQSIDDARFPSGFVMRLDLEERPVGTDLADALERVAGLRMRRASSYGQPAFASVRGGNPRQLAVSLNDMRISVPSGYGFNMAGLPMSGIDSVDVYRGSSATVYGGGALTGAINVKTTPSDQPGWSASAGSMAGSFGTFGLNGQTSYGSEHGSFQLDGAWRRSDGDFGYRDPQGTDHIRENNDHQHFSLLGTGRFELGDHTLEPTLLFDGGETGMPGPAEFQDEFDRARLQSRRAIGQLRWEHRAIADGEWGVTDAHASMGYQLREATYRNAEAFPGGSSVRDRKRHHSLSMQAGTSSWFNFGDMLHASVEARRETYDSTHQVDGRVGELALSRYTAAPSLSNEWLIFDQRVSVVTSARLEAIAEQVRSQRGQTLDANDGNQWTRLIPAAGVAWRANPGLRFKSNVARTFRAPNFDELYLDIVGMRGNPALEPEAATNVDLGVELGADEGDVRAEVAGFYNDIDEMIHFVATTAYLYEAQNLGSGTSFGIEGSARWQVLPRLSLSGHYTWTESSLDALSDTLIPGQPRHQTGGALELDASSLDWLGDLDGFDIRAEADWRSQINLDPFGNLENPGFWTVDASARMRPVPWLEAAVNVRNITDNRWGADSLQRPLAGRAVFVSVGADAGRQ